MFLLKVPILLFLCPFIIRGTTFIERAVMICNFLFFVLVRSCRKCLVEKNRLVVNALRPLASNLIKNRHIAPYHIASVKAPILSSFLMIFIASLFLFSRCGTMRSIKKMKKRSAFHERRGTCIRASVLPSVRRSVTVLRLFNYPLAEEFRLSICSCFL